MDERYAEVSVMVCPDCGQHWLRVQYEEEAFTSSGRWYMGAITAQQAQGLAAKDAAKILEKLSWYYSGGSYFKGSVTVVQSVVES